MKPKKKPARFVADGSNVTYKHTVLVATFYFSHPDPVQAARAEARRLNAWWARRKGKKLPAPPKEDA